MNFELLPCGQLRIMNFNSFLTLHFGGTAPPTGGQGGFPSFWGYGIHNVGTHALRPLTANCPANMSCGDLGEVLLHIICLHLSLGEEPTGLRPSDGSGSSPLDIRAVGYAHGARLEQTFACPAAYGLWMRSLDLSEAPLSTSKRTTASKPQNLTPHTSKPQNLKPSHRYEKESIDNSLYVPRIHSLRT